MKCLTLYSSETIQIDSIMLLLFFSGRKRDDLPDYPMPLYTSDIFWW